ncbi:STAS domain-containing protein [Streptomyces sp. 4.24]|uniref:STAS domain-containing protein n=1 Tax=Streptomyces tritrimontium TaxID=3406573 RepID=UPI003BB52149
MVERPAREAGGKDIAVEVLDRAVAVRPVGEMDIENASALLLALTEALALALAGAQAHADADAPADAHASPAKAVVVDCSRLTFCDSSALNALLTARRAAQEAGTAIRLAAPGPQLLRLLELTGALALFPVDPTPPPAPPGRLPGSGPDGLPR